MWRELYLREFSVVMWTGDRGRMTVPIDVAVSREPWVYQCARGCRERKTVCVTHGDGSEDQQRSRPRGLWNATGRDDGTVPVCCEAYSVGVECHVSGRRNSPSVL